MTPFISTKNHSIAGQNYISGQSGGSDYSQHDGISLNHFTATSTSPHADAVEEIGSIEAAPHITVSSSPTEETTEKIEKVEEIKEEEEEPQICTHGMFKASDTVGVVGKFRRS